MPVVPAPDHGRLARLAVLGLPEPRHQAQPVGRRWIATREASRIVTVTKAGEAGLHDWLGIDLAGLRAPA